MPKEEWGVKRLCPNCSTRFYDLQRNPMTCPACGHSFDLESLTGAKSQSTASSRKAKPAKAAAPAEEAEVIEDDNDSDVSLGDDVLEDDDEDSVDLDDLADVPAEDNDES